MPHPTIFERVALHRYILGDVIRPNYIRVRVGMRRGTDRHTDGRDQYTFRLGYASREM